MLFLVRVIDTDESDNQDPHGEEYYCGECGLIYEEDGELWIGCDGDCEGWLHAVCVGVEEGCLPENFYCDKCNN